MIVVYLYLVFLLFLKNINKHIIYQGIKLLVIFNLKQTTNFCLKAMLYSVLSVLVFKIIKCQIKINYSVLST